MPVEISLVFRDHPDENVLEEYAFGRLNDAKLAVLEEHILVCERCRSALAETDDYIRLMKFAASRPMEMPRRRSKRTAIAAEGVLAAACLAAMSWFEPHPAPSSVTLGSLGGAGAPMNQAAAGHPLDLSISTASLPPAAKYHLEVVNSTGESVWSGAVGANNGRVSAHIDKSLGAGAYWVKLYAQPSKLLAEYGLQVR
jgi:hypothetical protein